MDIFETLKTEGIGISGWLAGIVSLLVGVATFTYLAIKIYKEIK